MLRHLRQALALPLLATAAGSAELTREGAEGALKKAATYFRNEVARYGGYVFYCSEDLQHRYGEGVASPDQIWVQPPGTPAVGLSYLQGYQATGDRFFLDAAIETAEALMHGQLKSGGWTAWVDFDPKGSRVADYLRGSGRGRNYSSLDDGQTQTATRLLVRLDAALGFKDRKVHEAAQIALDALLAAQFANGGFPQVWSEPVAEQPIVPARFPDYDWRTEGRIKEYWDLYTLNDDLAVTVAELLIAADEVYEGDPRFETALRKLGEFLILAQMPEPQPAWAQQYNYDMNPAWARKFEPPGISGHESQGAMRTLMRISENTGDRKYLEPIPRALAYLQRQVLPDGKIPRFIEMETDRPLYMRRRGKVYTLTYDDSDLPKHYAFKVSHDLGEIEEEFQRARAGRPIDIENTKLSTLEKHARAAVEALDERGRWLSRNPGKLQEFGERVISSEVFSDRVEALCEYLAALKTKGN